MRDTSKSPSKRAPIRIWVDGCFDMMHYGHANALRQAKAMGDYLVVGVHSDAEIALHKGPTVMRDQERYDAVAACKWVDEVVPNAPYFTTVEMLDKYNCDFCVHGDDITTLADGTDCYAAVKAAGRYRECPRTRGVSTTELVGRMLLMTREHHQKGPANEVRSDKMEQFVKGSTKQSPYTTVSHFLPTSRRIIQFSEGREPKPTDRIVYVDGGFDLFHVGHIEFLKKARSLGDYLLVGVHDDSTINHVEGQNFPLMNLHERVLSVLACRYVDEVIIGAPFSVTKDVLDSDYKVAIVAHGKTDTPHDVDGADPYKLPKESGIYQEIETDLSNLTTDAIINRIIDQRKLYEARNRRKEAKEVALLEEKKTDEPNQEPKRARKTSPKRG